MIQRTPSIAQTHACDTVYTVVSEMPSFPGGSEALMDQMRKTIIIPTECELEKLFYMTWIVDSSGKATDWAFPRADENCQKKVTTRFKDFPRWNPGRKNGEAVCVRMSLKYCIKVN